MGKKVNEILLKGVIPGNHVWAERAKHWFYAHGGRICYDGTLAYTDNIKSVTKS